jgi:hypothetical protein
MGITQKEFLEKALLNEKIHEAMKLPHGAKIAKEVDKLLYGKKAEGLSNIMDDLFGKTGMNPKILRGMEKLSGKPQFGKASPIGKLISSLKDLQIQAEKFNEKFDDILEDFRKTTDWQGKFKELDKAWDKK